MTNCNSLKFPSTCQESTLTKTFHNTGEIIRYQEIDPISTSLLDDVVLKQENGKYYKAIYTENTINIEWYRCTYPTDLTNGTGDKVMLTKAINTAAYLGATLRFDAKEYIVNEQLSFDGISCFKLLGDKQHTLIKPSTNDRVEGFYLSFNDCHNFIIEGLRFDQNKRNLPVYNSDDNAASPAPKEFNGSIYITESSNIEITDCSFFDLYNRAVNIYSCHRGHILVRNNLFESGVQEQKYVMEHLVIAQSRYAEVVIENNSFKNAENTNPDHGVVAIFAFDLGEFKSVLVNNNYFEYCGRNHAGGHRLYAIDFYDNVNNFIISNNIFENMIWGVIRFDGTRKNGIISNNIIHQLIADEDGMIMSSSREEPKYNQTEFKNISINNNILDSSSEFSHGITIQGLSPFCAAENIEISHNKMYNLRYGVKIHGDVSVVSINNNQVMNLIGIGIEIDGFKRGYDTSLLQSNNVEKIYINDNHLNGRKEAQFVGFIGVQVNGLSGNHTFMGRMRINDNFISGNSKGSGVTINIINVEPLVTVSSLDDRIAISSNEINNVKYGLFLRCHENFVKDNIFYDCVQPFLEDYTDNIKVGNYHNNLPI
ncbi:hypothetical protein A0O34_06165 [Chryseobacterium glaciei]|uniref:Right handed beta helix domain-containing protein n=1 Tax=Chryseobacterium glaciei TaxID=1685010 RepID=A0A172XT16_9FLAO|nr:right-handed parallel beta-helix repeat-containing protein [Chryseobacterium glaciei]ANF50118.1 hypothetical protein A0O34_06165 [Chryseobacterium glaciei]